MNTVDVYYNKLLSIVNLRYASIKSLSTNKFDIKEIISNIIDAGNEYILAEPYLYSFVLKAAELDNFKTSLASILIDYTTSDKNILIDKVSDLYQAIYYFNGIDIYYHKLSGLEDMIHNGKVPLLNELKELCNIIDDKVYTCDFFILRDILFIVLSYCIVNNEEDNFLEYSYDYSDYPNMVIEHLILNGIIQEINVESNFSGVYLTNTEELKKYVILKINNTKKRLIKK